MVVGWLLAAAFAMLAALLTLSAWRARRDFTRAAGVFRCNIRLRSAHAGAVAATWGRAPGHALWVHDVLVIRNGLFRPRVRHLAAHMAEGGLVQLNPRRVPGLGRRPVSVRVHLDDDGELELAAAGEDRSLLVGPFVVVAMSAPPGDEAPGDF